MSLLRGWRNNQPLPLSTPCKSSWSWAAARTAWRSSESCRAWPSRKDTPGAQPPYVTPCPSASCVARRITPRVFAADRACVFARNVSKSSKSSLRPSSVLRCACVSGDATSFVARAPGTERLLFFAGGDTSSGAGDGGCEARRSERRCFSRVRGRCTVGFFCFGRCGDAPRNAFFASPRPKLSRCALFAAILRSRSSSYSDSTRPGAIPS
mmetsp:Transcript_15952/g.48244  ORF Transcript_15952/g.48244 Transcript_15952/m.48244 type:complete len:210 (+) Transcript_15952:207-836(+)